MMPYMGEPDPLSEAIQIVGAAMVALAVAGIVLGMAFAIAGWTGVAAVVLFFLLWVLAVVEVHRRLVRKT